MDVHRRYALQFVAFHIECKLGLKVLNWNAYPPKLKKSQTLKLPLEYI
jgi:hypothetical protein